MRALGWFALACALVSGCASAVGAPEDPAPITSDDATPPGDETGDPEETSSFPPDEDGAPPPSDGTPPDPPPDTATPPPPPPSGPGTPPFGASSKGSGGATGLSGTPKSAGSINYYLIVPGAPKKPSPLLIVFSGVEGGATMTKNLLTLSGSTGIGDFICAVLDGKTYFSNGAAGATVLDDVRAKYDIDNDRTYLLGESAGTRAALQLGFRLRQSYFAAYWANDVNATDTPDGTAATLGFAPWGQAGPGGQIATATDIVTKMKAAGYRLPTPAPYAGPGYTTHGSPDQFIAALKWFPGKTRK